MRVLLVEDNDDDFILIQELLSDARGPDLELFRVDRLSLAEEHIEREEVDVVLLDLSLPDSCGLETFTRLHERKPDVPVILLTSLADEAIGVEAVHRGAQDFLPKGELTSALVMRAMRYAVERHSMHRALRDASTFDELTGLHNRRGFFALAEQQRKMVRRPGGPESALLFIDLDELKLVNDSDGHGAGDDLIRETAAFLRKTFRESDILARLGGDEFVVLTAWDTREPSHVVERLERKLHAYNAARVGLRPLSMSVGVTPFAAGKTLEELLAEADQSMYTAKSERRLTARSSSVAS